MNKPNDSTPHLDVNVRVSFDPLTIKQEQEEPKTAILQHILQGIDDLLLGQKGLRKFMANLAERTAALRADINDLSDAERAAFQRLQDLIAAGQTLTAEQEAEFDALERQLEEMAAAAHQIGLPPPTP